jgi:hypothetical protein
MVDGAAGDPPEVLVEAYARIGPLKGGNFHKVARDALKLLTVRELAAPDARLILLFADEAAAASIGPRSWLRKAFDEHAIEVHVADIDDALRDTILQAQARQRMVNPPPPEEPLEEEED